MPKHTLGLLTLSLILTFSASTNATDTPPNSATQSRTMPYGDNPNIFRVLTYKTGQGLTRLGDSMQRGADQSSAKISEKWQEAKIYGKAQSQVAKEQTAEAKTYTQQKWQQTKEAIIGTNASGVPIAQGDLSQTSTAQTTRLKPITAPISPPVMSTTPHPESANP